MLNFYDILARSHEGPYLKEQDWDLQKVAMTTMQLVQKYDLSWDKEQIITDDPDLADALFKAGLELAQTLGVYNRTTERVIEFSPQELESGLRSMPQELIMGEGKDARRLFARRIMDPRPPLIWGGNSGAPVPESIFLQLQMSYAQEPIIDFLCTGSLTRVGGIEVRTRGPMEIVATRREMEMLRTTTRRVGRPGMGILAAASAVSELGDVAVANPEYMRPSDSHLVPMLNELKMDSGNLARAVNSIEYGVVNASLPCVIVGGMGGSPPGCAVINVASFILSNLVALADYHICHPIHIRHVATSTREVLWVENVVGQAFARNAPCIMVMDCYPKSGAGTKELLYETAANSVVNTLVGGHLEGPGSADGAKPNCSGLEARFMGEVGHAVARQGLSLHEGNTLVLELLTKYEAIFDDPEGNPGLPFEQVYDLMTIQPKPEWQSMYEEVKGELRQMGLTSL
jgi:methylamine--corrinoid protein Co-methyltransferase